MLLGLRVWALYYLNVLGDRAPQAVLVGEPLTVDLERVLGPDHPHTLNSRNNLALACQAAGRTGEAIALHEQTLVTQERVLDPDHPDTLTSRNNLANAYQAAGRADEAISLHEQTLADYEWMLDPDHPDTLASRGNLANAYWSAGRAGKAIPLHEQTLAARERVLGLVVALGLQEVEHFPAGRRGQTGRADLNRHRHRRNDRAGVVIGACGTLLG